jgi:hypothetical protein
MHSTVYLAAEDEPGLAVGRKLIGEHPGLTIFREENARGYGTLKRKAPSYDEMGRTGLPVLLLTDLDDDPCPSGKIADWLRRTPSPGFLFRVCVREVEAWLLADREAMAGFLRIAPGAIPAAPESLPDPKAKLIELAQKSPHRIRKGLTPIGSASIGPGYNKLLEQFIADSWCLDRAARGAPSLSRARQRVRELACSVTPEAGDAAHHSG